MKAIETVLHLRRAHPRRMKSMIPAHVWRLVAPYGLAPEPGEVTHPKATGTVADRTANAYPDQHKPG
jgi:coenzyme F420 hydrogenase subunit beta